MKKLAIVLTIAVAMTMVFSTFVFAEDVVPISAQVNLSLPEAKVTVNGNEVKWQDQKPVNISGMVFVPIRETLEAFGQTVEWEKNEKRTVETADKNTKFWAKLSLDSANVATKQEAVERNFEMVTVPKLINGKTMVSIRALTEIYGKNVGYDNATKTVLVYDYTEDNKTIAQLDAKTTYEGFIGDIVKFHYSTDGSYDYKMVKNNNFMLISKEAEGVGGYSMYLRAVEANKDAKIELQKVEMKEAVEGKVLETQTFKANVADPCDKAVLLKEEGKTDVKVGDYAKITLKEQAASTGYSWFITACPSLLVLVETKSEAPATDLMGAPNEISFVFKVAAEGVGSLQMDKMRGWGGESAETVKFEVAATKK